MNTNNLEEIIAAVTRSVIEAMGDGANLSGLTSCCGSKNILVIGDPAKVPERYTNGAVIYGLDDYEKRRDATFYAQIIFAKLSMCQLVDCAMGKPSDPACCAMTYGLLSGVEVIVLDEALPHRKYVGKGSGPFYRMYEDYVTKLQSYGVHLVGNSQQLYAKCITPDPVASENAAKRIPQLPGNGRLINEYTALELAKAAVGEGEVHVPANAMLTPSAKDVFARAKINVIRDI